MDKQLSNKQDEKYNKAQQSKSWHCKPAVESANETTIQ